MLIWPPIFIYFQAPTTNTPFYTGMALHFAETSTFPHTRLWRASGISSEIFFRKLAIKSVLIQKKYHNTYLHVLPVICDGGFSRCALAMLWNQLNYITTVQVHNIIDLFRNALLGFLRVLGSLQPTALLWIERVGS